jgi:hypothetical protein
MAASIIYSSDFGPDSTGHTPCSTQLQAAVDAAGGGVLVIEPGTYLLDAGLQVASHTTIYAQGATFHRVGTLDNMIRNQSDGTVGGYSATSYIRIIGGTWDSTAGAGAPSGNCTVMAFGHCQQVLVERAAITNENQWHHIEFNAAQDCTVRDCTFTGGYDTAYTGNESIQIDSADTAGQFPWFGPYDNTHCQHILVTANRFLGVGNGVGTHSETVSINHQDIMITDNVFANVYYAAVKPLTWSAFRVRGNRMESVGYGVKVQQNSSRDANDFEINDNSIYLVGTGSFTGDCRAIQVHGNANYHSKNFRICNNAILSVTSAGTHGITVDYGQHGQITGNTIDTVARSGIFPYAGCDGIVIANNTIYNENTAGAGYQGIRIGTVNGAVAGRIVVTNNYCSTLSVSYAQRSFVTNNNVYTSLTQSNVTDVTVVNNLVGTTWG